MGKHIDEAVRLGRDQDALDDEIAEAESRARTHGWSFAQDAASCDAKTYLRAVRRLAKNRAPDLNRVTIRIGLAFARGPWTITVDAHESAEKILAYINR